MDVARPFLGAAGWLRSVLSFTPPKRCEKRGDSLSQLLEPLLEAGCSITRQTDATRPVCKRERESQKRGVVSIKSCYIQDQPAAPSSAVEKQHMYHLPGVCRCVGWGGMAKV